MNLSDFNQSKYLAGKDLPEQGLDVTIGSFEIVKMNDGSMKPAVTFTQAGLKPMLLNKTNRSRLEILFRTSQTEAMIGQRVGIFFDRMVQGPNGDMVGGLRIRPATGAMAATQGYQPGHMPNPARVLQGGPLAPPGFVPQVPAGQSQPQNLHESGDWTQEVPF